MGNISMDFFSQALERYVTVKAVLPFDETESAGSPPYKTLYFLPGYSANAFSILSSSILDELSAVEGFALIIPDGENSFYTNQEDVHALYETFISEELLTITRKLLPLSDKREDTYIGGISMGGFGSLMLGSRHIDTFSKILALSPVTDPYCNSLFKNSSFTRKQFDRYFANEERYRADYHPSNILKRIKAEGKKLPDIFLCCGEQDPLTYDMDRRFVSEMEESNIPVTAEWGRGAHTPMYWNALLPAAINFMLKD